MTYRFRNIAIAVALAVLAAMMTSFYVKQQKHDIQQGQVLTTVWVAKSDIPSGSAGDDIAVQLPGDQNQLLVGTLQAGDHVDIVGSWQLSGNENEKVSRIVLRDILVLQAPEASSENKRVTQSSGDQAIMLAVTDAQAQKLFW